MTEDKREEQGSCFCIDLARKIGYPGAEWVWVMGVATLAMVRVVHAEYLPEIQKYL